MIIQTNKKDFFCLINKPINLTSFDVIRNLRKQTGLKKIGHTGTLDPLATGLLLVAFWNYTKLIPYFEKDSKEYEFEFSLEGTTASLDAEEKLIPAPLEVYKKQKIELSLEKIQEILKKNFLGEIEQIPPKYSALKINGKRAVDRVRAGEEVEIKKRQITVYNIEILDFRFPRISLRAKVSAGTYIRTIAGDFGDLLWTGAYVTKLKRTKIWKLWFELSQDLDNFSLEKALPSDIFFSKEKFISLPDEVISRLNQWQRVKNTLWIKPWEYFIKNNTHITHIIEVNECILKMKRKIL